MHWMNLHESEARRLLAILLVSQEIAHKKLRKIIMLSGMADSLRQAPMISMCWDKERWGDNLFFLFGVTLGVTSAQKIGAPCDAEAGDENHFGYRPVTSVPLDVSAFKLNRTRIKVAPVPISHSIAMTVIPAVIASPRGGPPHQR